jgi:hypothetical protein
MMKNMCNIHKMTGLLAICITGSLLLAGCRKNDGDYNYQNQLKQFDGTIYDFLKQQQQYDSFLLAANLVHRTDLLKNKDSLLTVFAPTDASFRQAIDNMNTLRTIQGRPLMGLSGLPVDQLDSLVCRYIIRGKVGADSMQLQDGITLNTIDDYPMHGKLNRTTAEGYVKGGPGVIQFSDTKHVIYTNRWSNTSTVAIDINTKNGYVNVLEKDHMFGFDEFISRMNPTYSTPWSGEPMFIPGTIGLEMFDRGGEGVAYHDRSRGNAGGQFRPAEDVDITTAENNSYKVGWTETDEWMKYTIQIMETGDYDMLLRYGSAGDNGRLHLELDGVRIPGSSLLLSGTGDWSNYRDVHTTLRLPEGKHVLTVYYDYAYYDLRFIKFMPKGRPIPIPGCVQLEDYNPGGEGVGYHNTTDHNDGGQYKPDDGVGIAFAPHEGGGYVIGWTRAGEWLEYDVDVKTTGFYNAVTMMGTAESSKKTFHIEFDGTDVTGQVSAINTGGYDKRTAITTPVHLTKGKHKMRFVMDTGGYDVKSVTFKLVI